MQHSSEFTRSDWLKRVEGVLKGAAFDAEAALQGRIDGPRAFRSAHAPWQVFARIDHIDTPKAKAQALDDLAHGVDGLILTSIDAAGVLGDLSLHSFALRNEAGDFGAESIRAAVARQPIDPSRLDIDLGLSDESLVNAFRQQGFAGPFMMADGRPFHGLEYSDGEELGATLAEALTKLRKLEFLDDADLAGAVSLTLSASQDMFATLAKFRAARILWSNILSESKLPDVPLRLHGETSRVMLSPVDAHSNILRTVTAVFGAGLGGADSFSVLPFSFNQGLPNSFARRVARNVQTLLLHESHLWRVDDPAAGAGAIEQRTGAICDQAWAVMQDCEKGHKPQPSGTTATAVIGVTKYCDTKQHTPEVEAAS